MVKRFDHVTIAVRDLDRAKAFFGLLGFVEDKAAVISGPIFSAYMGLPLAQGDLRRGPRGDHGRAVRVALKSTAPA